jgi:hypothetical protein
VRESGSATRLTKQPVARAGVGKRSIADELQRDLAPKTTVDRAVHDPHAALAEPFLDLEVREAPPHKVVRRGWRWSRMISAEGDGLSIAWRSGLPVACRLRSGGRAAVDGRGAVVVVAHGNEG